MLWPGRCSTQHALDPLRSAGDVLHPEPGEQLWDAGDPYDLYLVLAGGVLLVGETTGWSSSSRRATSSASRAC